MLIDSCAPRKTAPAFGQNKPLGFPGAEPVNNEGRADTSAAFELIG